MKKQINKKQGFSLIELIVVIAVIAAIAAVIVPSIGNFSDTAESTTALRNIQLFNSTYQQAIAAGAIAAGAEAANTASMAAGVGADLDGDGNDDVEFTCPAPSADDIANAGVAWDNDQGYL